MIEESDHETSSPLAYPRFGRFCSIHRTGGLVFGPGGGCREEGSRFPLRIAAGDQEGRSRRPFLDGRILQIEKEVEGEDVGQFDFEILSGGKQYEVEVSKEAKIKKPRRYRPTSEPAAGEKKEWTKDFDIENCEFSSVGTNRFFNLTPGHQAHPGKR